MTEIILTEEQKKQDQLERVKKFKEEYGKLVEKYQVDFQAGIQPTLQLIDIKK